MNKKILAPIVMMCILGAVVYLSSTLITPIPSPTATQAPVPTSTLVSTPTIQASTYLQAFEYVWNTINDTYFDPDFCGLDWEAVHERYQPIIAEANDDEMLYQMLNQMLWELKTSHAAVGPAAEWPSVEPVVWVAGETGLDVRLIDGQAVVTRVKNGTPAELAGLRAGYIIQSIGGTPVEQIIADVQTHLAPPYNDSGRIEQLTRHLLSLIYGDPGTCVGLVYRDDTDKSHEGCVVRIPRPRVGYLGGGMPPFYLEFESRRLENEIGYIRFNTFYPDLVPDMVAALAEMQDAPGIIIDLRGNPGGEFSADEQMAALFLDGQVTFGKIKARSGTTPWIVNGKNAYAGPLIILIDALSFSGSEFFTSGMQAVGRAVIIGERTPGGASAGNLAALPNGAILVYPVSKLLTPDGKVVEGNGIIPDISVPLERSQLLTGIDAQLQAAVQYIIEATQ